MDANRRLHALDNLRAHMMLLGVVFHVAINYSTGEPNVHWPFRDHATDPLIAGLADFIHLFRMPVFFIVAGFFSALLIHRRSIKGLLQNRAARIGLPFMLFLLPVIWLCGNGLYAAMNAMNGTDFSWHSLATVPEWNLHHLWFLYFLMIFYVAFCVLFFLLQAVTRLRQGLQQINQALWHRHAPVLMGAVSGLCLFASGSAVVPAPLSFIPDPILLGYYFVFFLGGASLYAAGSPLKHLTGRGRYWSVLMLCALIGFVAAEMVVLNPETTRNPELSLAGGLALGIFVWSLALIIMGFYIKRMNHESATGRYFTDASYWIYLAHLPMAICFPLITADLPLGAWTKFSLNIGLITLICVASYHLLVRSTWLGALLNGKRYPFRWHPWPDKSLHPGVSSAKQ